ncbi:MAG: hypothetical protein QMD77_05210 [Patescibacteria group bacterium]|nr:hypothetical protein [Patescibacteria group bacterium]
MKQKKKKAILASLAIFAMVALATPVVAEDRGPMPAEDDFFWDVFAAMTTPEDYSGCVSALNTYITNHPEEFGGNVSEVLAQMTEMCVQVGLMRTDMQTNMTAEGVVTSLFDAGNTNWHAISGLYFQKSENGAPMGRISFSQPVDFMSYRFFTFMNNFGNMVQFDDGYISLNAAMVPDMINYGTTFTMYGLDFPTTPDIYVTTAGGSTMRKANNSDLSGISYNSATGELSFTPGHFSAFKAVAKGTKVKKMKISSVKKKTIKYNANQSSFTITVKGTSLYSASGLTCMLGFNSANVVTSNVKGKKITCQFDMSNFSATGWYPLTVTAPGVGEVRKTNGVKIK